MKDLAPVSSGSCRRTWHRSVLSSGSLASMTRSGGSRSATGPATCRRRARASGNADATSLLSCIAGSGAGTADPDELRAMVEVADATLAGRDDRHQAIRRRGAWLTAVRITVVWPAVRLGHSRAGHPRGPVRG